MGPTRPGPRAAQRAGEAEEIRFACKRRRGANRLSLRVPCPVPSRLGHAGGVASNGTREDDDDDDDDDDAADADDGRCR